jgi:hypothetical protein
MAVLTVALTVTSADMTSLLAEMASGIGLCCAHRSCALMIHSISDRDAIVAERARIYQYLRSHHADKVALIDRFRFFPNSAILASRSASF